MSLYEASISAFAGSIQRFMVLLRGTGARLVIRWALSVVGFGVVASFGLGAHAADGVAEIKGQYPPCDREPSAADITAAGGAHRAAMEAYGREQFDRAARLWTEAYGFDCSRPLVFLNLGQAFEKAGDKRSAVAAYQLLIERAPADAPADLQARVDELERDVAREDAELAKKKAADDARAAKEAAAKRAAAAPPERPFGVVPWVGVGVGGAAAIAGGVLLGVGLTQASSAADECSQPATRTGCPSDAIDDGEMGETMSMVGQGLLYGGGGVLAVSLVVQFVFNDERPADVAGFVPSVGPDFAGGTYVVRF